MSMPNVHDIKPEIKLDRKDVINLLLASIGLEELSLAHLENAEAEKLQTILHNRPDFHELLIGNRSVERLLRTTIKKEMLLEFKLEDIIDFLIDRHDFC